MPSERTQASMLRATLNKIVASKSASAACQFRGVPAEFDAVVTHKSHTRTTTTAHTSYEYYTTMKQYKNRDTRIYRVMKSIIMCSTYPMQIWTKDKLTRHAIIGTNIALVGAPSPTVASCFRKRSGALISKGLYDERRNISELVFSQPKRLNRGKSLNRRSAHAAC